VKSLIAVTFVLINCCLSTSAYSQDIESLNPQLMQALESPVEGSGITLSGYQAAESEPCVVENCVPSSECVSIPEPFCSSCCDSLWTRTSLTNGFWGAQGALAQKGIVADISMTQFYQGVSSGGVNREFKYGGKTDYMFTFLGEPLGINPGFSAILHAETRFGEDITPDAGLSAFPNANMLYPAGGEHVTSISGLMIIQAINERFALTAGKYNLLDLWNMLYPNTGRGIDGFMNLSILAPVPLLRTTNLSINGAGALVMHGQQIQGALLVYDTNNSSTTVGLSDIYDQGAVILGFWRMFTDFHGLQGSHAVIGNWSSRTYTSIDRSSWTVIPGKGLVAGQETGSWTIGYILDQILWSDCCDENRNVRLMSQWMIADDDPNIAHWSGNVALQADGVFPCRAQDSMGVGYFYNSLSDHFIDFVSPLASLPQEAQGVELYYNAAITPWFHVTADLQIVESANTANDTSVMPGLRAKITF
jgi:porin